mmetsp:Transcript_19501/g.48795  ORF Transcript_19501/g.48795 Transcript_19501/m.48795 type:complete len:299 (-) Transcript_19501:180-1076(-)
MEEPMVTTIAPLGNTTALRSEMTKGIEQCTARNHCGVNCSVCSRQTPSGRLDRNDAAATAASLSTRGLGRSARTCGVLASSARMATMGAGHSSLNDGRRAGSAMVRMVSNTRWNPGTLASGHLDCLNDSTAVFTVSPALPPPGCCCCCCSELDDLLRAPLPLLSLLGFLPPLPLSLEGSLEGGPNPEPKPGGVGEEKLMDATDRARRRRNAHALAAPLKEPPPPPPLSTASSAAAALALALASEEEEEKRGPPPPDALLSHTPACGSCPSPHPPCPCCCRCCCCRSRGRIPPRPCTAR